MSTNALHTHDYGIYLDKIMKRKYHNTLRYEVGSWRLVFLTSPSHQKTKVNNLLPIAASPFGSKHGPVCLLVRFYFTTNIKEDLFRWRQLDPYLINTAHIFRSHEPLTGSA